MIEHNDSTPVDGGPNHREANQVLLWTEREWEKPLSEAQNRYVLHLHIEALGQHDPWHDNDR